MTEKEKQSKLNKMEILANVLWTAFGIIGGLSYYAKGEYLIWGIISLLGILYAYKLFKSITGK